MTSLNKIKEKLLNNFKKEDINLLIFKKFTIYIIKEVDNKSIAISYAEKIIKSTYNYLIYCNNFQNKQPTQTSLEGYLWIYYSQKYFLKRFINYLIKFYKIELDITKIKKPVFKRPKKSHQILKQRVIYILNTPNDKHLTQKYIMDAFIGYFHWIFIPSNVFLSVNNIKKNNNNCFLKISTHTLFLPKEILKVKFDDKSIK